MSKVTRQKFLKTCVLLLGSSPFLSACGAASPTIGQPQGIAPTPTGQATPTTGQSQGISPTIGQGQPNPTPRPQINPTTTQPQGIAPTPTLNPTPNPHPLSPIPYPLNLEAKVGQRMLVVLPGTELTPAISNFLLTVRPGGIVMFAANISSLDQIRKLNTDLQTFAAKNNLPPFIITLDEEGGIVSRMPPDGREGVAPSQMAQAAAGLEAVKACARQTAIKLANLGFNLNLAPDADVNSNYQNPVIGTRSFGSDPTKVAQAVRAAIEEYKGQNVGCCVKHFPGHGDTNTDSHTGLPVVNKSRADLDRLELVPFREAIAAETPAIMTAHIVFPQIEPNSLPATLSPYFLTKVLREELKYQGLVISDALNMGAISSKYGLAEAGRLSLKAGADLIIPIGDLPAQLAVFNTLVASAKRGDFEIDKPVERILAFKGRYAQPMPQKPESPAEVAAAAQNSVTALTLKDKIIPLTAKNPVLINFALARATQVEGQPPSNLLSQLWREKFPNSGIVEISTNPNAAENDRALRAARAADLTVLVTRDAYEIPAQIALVQSLLASDTPVLIVAARDPYDLLAFPKAGNYLATYSDVPVSLRALMKVLTGEARIQGKLPVAIPGLFEVGGGVKN